MNVSRAVAETLRLHSPAGTAVLAGVLAAVLSAATPLGLLWAGVVVFAVAAPVWAVRNPVSVGSVVRTTGAGPLAWAGAGLLFVGGVAASEAVGAPRLGCRPPAHPQCISTFAWALAVFAGGCVAGAVAAGNWSRYRRVAVPVTGAGDLTPGRTAVVGRVRPVGAGVRSPATGGEVVAYRRESLAPSGLLDRPRPVERDGDAAQFYVVDGSGRALVVPGELDEHAVETWPTADPSDERTARERVLERDAVAVVAGRATEVDRSDYPAGVAIGVEGPVTVAATDRETLVGDLRWRVWSATALALLLGGGGLAGMLALA